MERASIAKLTRPRLSGIAPRERLFRLLDKGRNRPVTWVVSQAGSGKTTLVASWLDERKLPCLWYQIDAGDGDLATFFYYMGLAAKQAAPRHKKPLPLLTPEYLQSIPVFTRRYFEELFRRLKTPAILVLDNYQDAPPGSGFHEMIAHALETVPEGVNVVILSRNDPPPQLARLQANNRLQLIGWEDVRFTREESGELLKKQGHERPDKETAALLHEKTEGWAAGLVLLMAGAGASGADVRAFDDKASGGVFDYFASELFDKADGATQDVLLKTSFLQRIGPADAEQLTGNGMAGHVLERLCRNHYFTQKYDRAYQYHPLFREFLQSRAQSTLSPAEIAHIRGAAALLLETSGRPEEAVGLYIEARDWSRAERLLLAQAGTLVFQGRSNTLEGWLKRFPAEHIERSAWLLYWSGICRMAFDPYESRCLLEKSFELFRAEKEGTGTFLSWASIVDTFLYAWGDFSPLDRWIAVMEEILAGDPVFPSPEIEVRVAGSMQCAMANRQPGRSGLARWAERVQGIVVTSDNVQLKLMLGSQLIFYYIWVGDFSKIAFVVEALRPSGSLKEYDPLTRQNWYAWKAMYSWFVADWEACWQAISDGEKNAEDSGIHLLDLFLLAQGVFGGLSLGNPSAAVSCLEKMALTNSPRPGDKALYQYQASSVTWFQGDFAKSAEHGKLAVSLCESIGWPVSIALCLIELAVTHFDGGNFKEADACLSKALNICRGMNGLEFHASMHGARFALDRGREKQGIEFLERGLALGSRYGYLNLPRWDDRCMARLCAKALERGIEAGYVQELIRKRGLAPEGPVENWPYPVRIATLGRFRIEKDGKPLTFAGKVQKKPLELLKALIALGGENVTEESLAGALWPDADGDQAHRSFETTLYRLRKMVGDRALRFQEGLLSLDTRYCWTDAGQFESVVGNLGHARSPETARSMHDALVLYEGHFLPADTGAEWSVPLRERLRDNFTRLIVAMGGFHEELAEWEQALGYFQKGLQIDDLSEEFYQHAMTCQIRLGRHAQATSTYNRCRATLTRVLGIGPSQKTETIFNAMGNIGQAGSPAFPEDRGWKKRG